MTRPTIRKLDGPAPMPGAAFDLESIGYVEEEFLIEGQANSYRIVGERGADGCWTTEPDETSDYVTRIVVRRPIDPDASSGEAIVEWNNVSGGVDATPDWTMFHRHITQQGHTFVGVAAQRAGLHGGGIAEGMHLKKAFPERYADVEHPGDAFSFDIYSQVGELLREGGIDGIRPNKFVSVGASQSAMCLVTYINAIQPWKKVYDAFLVHGRGSKGAGLDGFRSGFRSGEAEKIRTDLSTPVIVLQSETDVVLLGGGRPQQPDGSHLRLWEIAGSAHADTYMLIAGPRDDGSLSPAGMAQLLEPTKKLVIGETSSPINGLPQLHYIGQAALEALSRWSSGGEPPPNAARLALDDEGRGFLLDEHGNAQGGIRTPWVDVPTTTSSGLGQDGGTFGMLFGTTTPFDNETLNALYPTGKTSYLSQFEAALDDTIRSGFISPTDRDEILALADAGYQVT